MGLLDVLASVADKVIDESISQIERNEKKLDRAEKNLDRDYKRAYKKAQSEDDQKRMRQIDRKREEYQSQIDAKRTNIDLDRVREQRDQLSDMYKEWKDSCNDE